MGEPRLVGTPADAQYPWSLLSFFQIFWFIYECCSCGCFHVKVRDDGSGYLDELMDVIASHERCN